MHTLILTLLENSAIGQSREFSRGDDCICLSKGLLLMKVHLTPKNRRGLEGGVFLGNYGISKKR